MAFISYSVFQGLKILFYRHKKKMEITAWQRTHDRGELS